jgi:hypothetical protein
LRFKLIPIRREKSCLRFDQDPVTADISGKKMEPLHTIKEMIREYGIFTTEDDLAVAMDPYCRRRNDWVIIIKHATLGATMAPLNRLDALRQGGHHYEG